MHDAEGRHEVVAANLTLALSESDRRCVLFIDADLRGPSIQRISGVPNVGGPNDALSRVSAPLLPDTNLSVTGA